jgi:hypothetical protein
MDRLFVGASLAALLGCSPLPTQTAAQAVVQTGAVDEARPNIVKAKVTAYLPAELAGSIERYELGRSDPQSPPLIKFLTTPENIGSVCARKLYIRYDRGDAERPAQDDPLIVHDELSYASRCERGGSAQFAQVVSEGTNLAWAKQALTSYLSAAREGSPTAPTGKSRYCFKNGQPRSCNPKTVSMPPLFGAEQLRFIATAPGRATLSFAASPTSNYIADVDIQQDRGGRSTFTVQQHPSSPG